MHRKVDEIKKTQKLKSWKSKSASAVHFVLQILNGKKEGAVLIEGAVLTEGTVLTKGAASEDLPL